MKRFALGLAVLPLLAGVAVAGQPLTDKQMDAVTAGFDIFIENGTNFSATLVAVNDEFISCDSGCYLDVRAGFVQVLAVIGPGFRP